MILLGWHTPHSLHYLVMYVRQCLFASTRPATSNIVLPDYTNRYDSSELVCSGDVVGLDAAILRRFSGKACQAHLCSWKRRDSNRERRESTRDGIGQQEAPINDNTIIMFYFTTPHYFRKRTRSRRSSRGVYEKIRHFGKIKVRKKNQPESHATSRNLTNWKRLDVEYLLNHQRPPSPPLSLRPCPRGRGPLPPAHIRVLCVCSRKHARPSFPPPLGPLPPLPPPRERRRVKAPRRSTAILQAA